MSRSPTGSWSVSERVGLIPGLALWPHSFSAGPEEEIWLALPSCLLISEALRVRRVGFSEKQSLRWFSCSWFTKEDPGDPHLRKGEEGSRSGRGQKEELS